MRSTDLSRSFLRRRSRIPRYLRVVARTAAGAPGTRTAASLVTTAASTTGSSTTGAATTRSASCVASPWLVQFVDGVTNLSQHIYICIFVFLSHIAFEDFVVDAQILLVPFRQAK